jgi:Domain of unknown function (DUF4340)
VAAEVAVSLRRILVLLVLAAALGTYLYVYEIPQAEQEGKKEKLLNVDKDAVTGLALAYPDREMALSKGDRGWRLTKPLDAAADEAAVKSLVGAVVDAEVQRTLDDVPQDLATFGLQPPSVTVRLTVKDGTQPPAVAVGKNTAIGGKTYVRRGDDPKILLTTTSLQLGLNKQPKDLRDKALLTFQDDDVTNVVVHPAGGEVLTLVRKDKDDWTIEPGSHRADPTEVRSYLSSLRATRAVDFPDDAPADLAKYGLDAPRLTVSVVTGKEGAEATRTLVLGGESTQGQQKQVYAKRAEEATVYALGEWSLRNLSKTAGQLRDKTVLGFDPARVGRVALERKDGATVTLARAGTGGWTIEGAEAGKKPAEPAISRFLDDLRDLRGADVAAEPPGDLARFGLEAPDLRIALTDKDGQAMGSVLGAKHGDKFYVMQGGGPTVFEARDYMYTRLDKQPKDFFEGAKATAATVPQVTAPAPAGGQPDAAGGDDDEDAEGEEE